MDKKLQKGQFFTEQDVFENNDVFIDFMQKNNLWNKKILEPFAGSNNLIKFLQKIKPQINYRSYDIEPKNKNVYKNDSINNWNYQGFDLVITNPPYLSKHSAKRMKIDVDFGDFDDLYKLSIFKCIQNVRFTVAIIPTTLINSNRKKDKILIQKLIAFQLLPNKQNFKDTEHPVALAYFDNLKNNENIDFDIYENNKFIEKYSNLIEIEKSILKSTNTHEIIFNKPNGNVCVNTGDNTLDKSNIRFLEGEWLSSDEVKTTDRHKVKLEIRGIEITQHHIDKLNNKINELRQNKCDYLWASFKGVSKNGHFRKRIDFGTIKRIINAVL
ncbi:hypothetical protein E1I18_01430 [Mycoplasmopsis mucosicanis]|uniref:Type II methyltransferase M.TaqI-like domain-containing protein n=1 Tax=Mycoplasmopsis mucosicanis TaxID=458208 RepID=A0A507SXW0_9BACT|nr:hypothetical protein [Mycoplasmopsis mucosicanis]TQC53968.1 hypothetical protein E1I18_01430 [Mycoplasmopsis mucosicanis]